MSTATMVTHESGYVRKVMTRNPQALFFTIGLPLLYLFIVPRCSAASTSTWPGSRAPSRSPPPWWPR